MHATGEVFIKPFFRISFTVFDNVLNLNIILNYTYCVLSYE